MAQIDDRAMRLIRAASSAAACGAIKTSMALAQAASRQVLAQTNDNDDRTGLGLMDYNPQSTFNKFQKLPQYNLTSGPGLGTEGSDAQRLQSFEMPMRGRGEGPKQYLYRLRQWLVSRNSRMDADLQKRVLQFMAQVVYGQRQMKAQDMQNLQQLIETGPQNPVTQPPATEPAPAAV